MNNHFDFDSKKYSILLVLVIICFTIFIIKMFDYMPAAIDDDNIEKTQKVEIKTPEIVANDENDENSEPIEEKHKKGHFDFMPKVENVSDEDNDFDEVSAPNNVIKEEKISKDDAVSNTVTSEDLALKSIIKGMQYKSANDISNALNEFQKVPQLTDDKELNAMSNAAIAEIYASQKRYGTALTFAVKAYNLSPNDSRELLVAKIYYKTGDTEKGIKTINDILQKKF